MARRLARIHEALAACPEAPPRPWRSATTSSEPEWVGAVVTPMPHSAETHLVRPPGPGRLPPGWTARPHEDDNPRFGTFTLVHADPGRPTPVAGEPAEGGAWREGPAGLPCADSVAGMTAALLREGLVHVPAALSRPAVAELKALFAELEPDPTSPLDRFSKSDGHRAAARAAADAGEPEPYVDLAIQTLFNRPRPSRRTAEPYPFLRYLDVDPVVAVAESALGAGCHVIQHNLWRTGPGRPRGNTHIDYLPLASADGAIPFETPLYVITAHYYLDDMYEELGPTRFTRRSHLLGRPEWQEQREEAPPSVPEESALVSAGDCVIFRSDVWHGAGGNVSTEARHIMQVHYSCDDMSGRQEPHTAPEISAAAMDAANARQRRLLRRWG